MSSTTRIFKSLLFNFGIVIFVKSLVDIFLHFFNFNVKKNLLPIFSILSTSKVPPNKFIIEEEIFNPNPVPPYFLDVDSSACENASKIFFCLSRGIPIPSSST